MQPGFEDKICLITGGAQGIGWAMTQAFAKRKAKVYACDISVENIQRARQELATKPDLTEYIVFQQCDVANRAAVEQWITAIYQTHQRIDILINNAAFTRWEDEDKISIEDTEKMMQVGFNGMLYGVKTVLPLMKGRGSGHIVNIGSSSGKVFAGGASAGYAAAKAALDGYTQVLQGELQKSPITLTLIRFGAVGGTDFFRKNVSSQRLPRLADFAPYLTPPQAAEGVIQAIVKKQAIANIPPFLKSFYILFELFPDALRGMMRGTSQRDYGAVQWEDNKNQPTQTSQDKKA